MKSWGQPGGQLRFPFPLMHAHSPKCVPPVDGVFTAVRLYMRLSPFRIHALQLRSDGTAAGSWRAATSLSPNPHYTAGTKTEALSRLNARLLQQIFCNVFLCCAEMN